MSGALWTPPRPLPAGVEWSARSRALSYTAAGRRRRLPAPVLAVETAAWTGLDGRVRFGPHRAGVLGLYAAAVALLRDSDPYLASRAASWQRVVLHACWLTAVALFEPAQPIQACVDALAVDTGREGASVAERRASALAAWAVTAAAVRLGEVARRR